MGLEIHRGSFGVTGIKMSFHQKCYFSFRLHGMIIYKLISATKVMGLNLHTGSLRVTGVKGHFYLESLSILCSTRLIHVDHLETLYNHMLLGQISIWIHLVLLGQKVIVTKTTLISPYYRARQ